MAFQAETLVQVHVTEVILCPLEVTETETSV